ncbi:PLAC8-domain-containing protein [Ophiobolus disseminans]|uniref:PLAC8-domain-containing protein n=1 Tax=Ophiobolus disseminans TaxID=1469910 RepID=A0A6A6ZXK1_9PLEO|nr:PLAC8-domain-containing protein [Ophiobolus disseminans]
MDHRQNGNPAPLYPQTTRRQHQRFSWQPSEGQAPVYEQVQYSQPPPQIPHHAQTQQFQQHAPPQPQVSTPAEQNRHFSYAQTPVEHEAFFYVSSPSDPTVPALPQAPQVQQTPVRQMHSPYTPIDDRPQSVFYPQIPLTSAVQPQPQSAYVAPSSFSHDEKHPVSPISPHAGPRSTPFSPVSPIPPPQVFAQPAPQPPVATSQDNHARKMSMASLNPINTNVGRYPMPPIPATPPSGHPASPLPNKTPITPISAGSTANGTLPRENRKSYANEPYSPHGFTSTQTNNLHAVFSPDAAHGPNGLDFALHQPGQIAHPNMESESSKDWSSSLCSCAPDPSTCLTGLFCPCILYGRTAYRLSQKSAKKDPTDMLGHSATNGHCMLMSVSCGLWWLFPMLQRTRIRHAYKLGGSMAGDLLRGCCCCCCVAVQNEREVKGREEASMRWAGPASSDVYARQGGMVYKPQQ